MRDLRTWAPTSFGTWEDPGANPCGYQGPIIHIHTYIEKERLWDVHMYTLRLWDALRYIYISGTHTQMLLLLRRRNQLYFLSYVWSLDMAGYLCWFNWFIMPWKTQVLLCWPSHFGLLITFVPFIRKTKSLHRIFPSRWLLKPIGQKCVILSTAKKLRKWEPVLKSIVKASKNEGNGNRCYICHQASTTLKIIPCNYIIFMFQSLLCLHIN